MKETSVELSPFPRGTWFRLISSSCRTFDWHANVFLDRSHSCLNSKPQLDDKIRLRRFHTQSITPSSSVWKFLVRFLTSKCVIHWTVQIQISRNNESTWWIVCGIKTVHRYLASPHLSRMVSMKHGREWAYRGIAPRIDLRIRTPIELFNQKYTVIMMEIDDESNDNQQENRNSTSIHAHISTGNHLSSVSNLWIYMSKQKNNKTNCNFEVFSTTRRIIAGLQKYHLLLKLSVADENKSFNSRFLLCANFRPCFQFNILLLIVKTVRQTDEDATK